MKMIRWLQETGKNFFKCGVVGWCLEVLFTSAESMMLHDWRLMGKTSLLMFPIYGMGALLAPIGRGVDRWLQVDQTPLRLQDRVMRHGVLYMVLIFTAEYCSGAWLKARGICPWDYGKARWNVGRIIRLDYIPCWAAAGLLMERATRDASRVPRR